jgi:hypothetical protein
MLCRRHVLSGVFEFPKDLRWITMKLSIRSGIRPAVNLPEALSSNEGQP